MAITLSTNEIRVLGVLIEKSMTQQQYYPMTLNAIVAAANQKTNREPVMELTEAEVATALHGLTQWRLASQAPPDRGSRSNRFRHEVESRFGWESPERAIMGELMLRGPQTVGEIRTRASRMTNLGDVERVRQVLSELERAEQPMVKELPRQPGRSSTRFIQLLGGDVQPGITSTNVASAPTADSAHAAPPTHSPNASLESRIAALESEVRSIRLELDRLKSAENPAAAMADDDAGETR